MKNVSTYLYYSLLALSLLANDVFAASRDASIDPITGFRVDRYRAPVPDSVPGGTTVNTDFVRQKQLAEAGTGNLLLIDVLPPKGVGADPLDGHWLLSEPHTSLAGAHWLPEVGRGTLSPEHEAYFRRNLQRLSNNNVNQEMVFFCAADCWQSWNAAKRAAEWGYKNVYWYPDGTDGYAENNLPLQLIVPINFLDDSMQMRLPPTASILLIDQAGNQTDIGRITFAAQANNQTSFAIELNTDSFSEHFLSMRPFKCLTGPADWFCYLPYPYQTHNLISNNDLTDLEYQLLFILKSPTEFGIDAWDGIYYRLSLTDDGHIKGTLLQGDLNVLQTPPAAYARPINLNEFIADEAHKQRFPSLVIRP